jgi:hypothetical protein
VASALAEDSAVASVVSGSGMIRFGLPDAVYREAMGSDLADHAFDEIVHLL